MSFMKMLSDKMTIQNKDRALTGRSDPITTPGNHFVTGAPLSPPYPKGYLLLDVGLGCFWGAERLFWETPGVYVTGVGYAGGSTPNPTYQEVCTGQTGHTEVVRIVYDPQTISLEALLRVFWENHDPTQGMRQGNDVGTQYRSALYAHNQEDLELFRKSAQAYKDALSASKNHGQASPITTEIKMASNFYWAEDYHQQYLAKNPDGYCGIKGTGVSCPISFS
ncbi:peptide-methionine (S)-S-oxide reductase MsrA [Flexibacterium corallicola]|uniref:peptide-methionine (S)-S-oxide reductase MsrA n=1 Tax=Flexibacterium corallicola TaxID=3037259 RepID=UPI00286F525A|nr:peptide-methionine (S)-S-oxide reductase MsrA [Pseudovibrio sp. M1P-2-3]